MIGMRPPSMLAASSSGRAAAPLSAAAPLAARAAAPHRRAGSLASPAAEPSALRLRRSVASRAGWDLGRFAKTVLYFNDPLKALAGLLGGNSGAQAGGEVRRRRC